MGALRAVRFSALLPCHAPPVRDARLRSVSSKTQSHCVCLGLLLSLRSIRAAHDGSALLYDICRLREMFMVPSCISFTQSRLRPVPLATQEMASSAT